MTLGPWPIHTPLWPGGSSTFAPTWSQWYSRLVEEVNPAKPRVFANLPMTPLIGQLATVSDSTTNVWGAVIAGGGAWQVLAQWNGSSWTVIGI